MTRYRYNEQVDPPAPFVHVELRRPDGSKDLPEKPAQLDIGADKTVIPSTAVDELGLVMVREISAVGFGGTVVRASAFLVQVTIRQQNSVVVEAISSRDEPYILLGRDVLNQFRVVLDGPKLFFEIESP